MLTLAIILFLAILFIVGLITTTLYSFPTKKWIQLTPIRKPHPSLHEKNAKGNNYNKAELRSIFATFDKNSDGYITMQELKRSLENIGIFMEDRDITDMVEKVDSNKDGLIDLDEFYELCHILGIESVNEGGGGEMNQEDLKEAFDVFDYDKDGLISEEELSKILSSLGLRKNLEHCKEMIRKVDVDGDGMVNFDEFKKMMNLKALQKTN